MSSYASNILFLVDWRIWQQRHLVIKKTNYNYIKGFLRAHTHVSCPTRQLSLKFIWHNILHQSKTKSSLKYWKCHYFIFDWLTVVKSPIWCNNGRIWSMKCYISDHFSKCIVQMSIEDVNKLQCHLWLYFCNIIILTCLGSYQSAAHRNIFVLIPIFV